MYVELLLFLLLFLFSCLFLLLLLFLLQFFVVEYFCFVVVLDVFVRVVVRVRSGGGVVTARFCHPKVAAECDAYVCGGISPTVSFKDGLDDSVIREEFRSEIEIFVQKKADFLLGEFFGDVKVIANKLFH